MHQHGGDVYSYKNFIDFSANINFCGMSKEVQKAAKDAVDLCEHYPDAQCRSLRAAIAKREQVNVEQVICGNGAADLIFSLVLALKPQKALLLAPGFYEYEHALMTVNCQIEKYYLQEQAKFEIQSDFLDRVTNDVDMVFLCNPNNPTGVLTEPDFLKEVLCRCVKTDTLLVMDECFLDFIEESEKYSMKAFVKEQNHLFLIKAFTKIYAMAGLRIGYGLCNHKELLARMIEVRQPWSVSVPAQIAGVVAANDRVYIKESREKIKVEREVLKKQLMELGYHVIGSRANYIFFEGTKGLYEHCLEKGILIRDCSNYDGLSEGWYRVAVKSYADNQLLLEALRR